VTEPSPEPEARGPAPPPLERQLNATTAALLGALLGIVGGIATTSIGAYYTSKEHAGDRAEARAKDQRDNVVKAYLAAINALHVLDQEATRWNRSDDPIVDFAKQMPKRLISYDVTTPLRLFGSVAAIKAFDRATYDFDMMLSTMPHMPERTGRVVGFSNDVFKFGDIARAEIQADRF
jgi:hypothetical protein